MSSSRLPKILIAAIVVGALAQCIFAFPLLPGRVASHFGPSGLPNGWMTKQTFFLIYAALIAGAFFIGFYPARVIARASSTEINLPNKDYWLAPERRPATMAFFERYFSWYSCIFLLTEVLAMGLAIQANLSPVPRLPTGPIAFIILGFVAFNIASVIQIFRRFSKITL